MKANMKAHLNLILSLLICLGQQTVAQADMELKETGLPVKKEALTSEVPVPQQTKTDSTKSEPVSQANNELSIKLSQALKTYKSNPNPVSFDNFWQTFWQTVQTAGAQHIELSQIFQGVEGFNDLGFRLTDAPDLKIFSFTRVPDCQQVLVEWKEASKAAAPAKPHIIHTKAGKKVVATKPTAVSSVSKWQFLDYNNNILINDARILISSSSAPAASAKTEKTAEHPAPRPNSKFLILCGMDKKTKQGSLQGYKMAEEKWTPCQEIFSGVPPYLLENVQGKSIFSGSNLILTSDAPKTDTSAAQTVRQNDASSSSYKIVLRFFNDHYALDTKAYSDTTTAIAFQFVQAIAKGRVNLVKAWLVDPKLASIPAYLGLYSRPANAPPFRLAAMSAPANGGCRFRLITYGKDDLIIDMGKVKSQWAVKGLFIAPPDSFAKKIGQVVQQDKSVQEVVE